MTGDVTGLQLVVGVAVVTAALVALVLPRRLGSVVAFLVFGVLLSLMWGLMEAPDVALAEAAIGAGVTGTLFVHAVTRDPGPRRARAAAGPRRWANAAGTLLAVGVALGLAFGLAGALRGVAAAPAAGGDVTGVGPLVARELPGTGVAHPVTGVLLGFRSYDTFLEVVVLLVAVVLALVLAGPPERGSSTAGDERAVPGLLRWFVRVTSPVLVLVAAWLLFAGSSSPGGAFQAGAVLVAVLVLAHLAGVRELSLHGAALRWVSAAGVVSFLLVAAAGLGAGGSWLQLDPAWAGGAIVVLETVLAVAIGASLAAVFLAVAAAPTPSPTIGETEES